MSNPPKDGATFFNDVWGWEDGAGNEYAAIGTNTNIRIYNVTDSRNPVKLYDKAGGNSTTWRDFKTYRNYLYAVCDNCSEGLEIIPLDSLPQQVLRADKSKFLRAHNIYIDTAHARLYAVGARYIPNNSNLGVIIYDISNPAVPQFISRFDDGKYVHDIYVKNHIGIASSGNSGTYVYDFTNASTPVSLMGSEIPLSVYHHSSWQHPDSPYIYSANEVPLGIPMQIYQIKNGSLVNAGSFNEPLISGASNNVPHNPYVHEEKLFISYYEDGVQVYDVSKPKAPTKIAYYDTHANVAYNGYYGCWGVFPFLKSGTILASDMSKGLMILGLDISAKANDILYLSEPGAGFCVRSKTNMYKIAVDNSGNITQQVLAQVPDATLIHNANIKADQMVLTAPSGGLYEVKFDTLSNQMVATSLPALPSGNVITIDKSLYFDDIYTGPVFQTGPRRHRLRVVNGAQSFLKME
ncbi:MAG: choice-of-anchor B family protein [Saprospiraceae bacterium]|nr:choice-of-anchor B family protein [Saprospiraceae bacterium]